MISFYLTTISFLLIRARIESGYFFCLIYECDLRLDKYNGEICCKISLIADSVCACMHSDLGLNPDTNDSVILSTLELENVHNSIYFIFNKIKNIWLMKLSLMNYESLLLYLKFDI